jgi:hypothetical protein
MGYSKSDPRHPMNSEKTTSDPKGLKPNKTQYAYGGKKIKMASYYSKGGTVFTGR